jgi:hypothetical protein
VDWLKINCYVMEKQHLTNKCNDVLKCVEDIAGLNSITAVTPYLSLFNRVKGFRKSMLDEELYEKKSLYRLRLMRGTLFIVTGNFLPIAYSATIDNTQRIYGRFRRYYNISEEELDKLRNEIIKALQEGDKAAKEIRKAIGIDDKNVSRVLRWLMEDIPLIRGRPIGTWKSEQFRYFLLPKNAKYSMDKNQAKTLLIEKFLESFGPATLEDLTWWSGFRKKESKDILEKVSTIDIGENLLLLEKEAKDFEDFEVDSDSLLLMSGFDQYVITYKYSICPRLVTKKNLAIIYNKYGEFSDPIIRNGRIIGRWYIKEGKISHLLYEKIKNEGEFHLKIRELEEFIKNT